MSGDFVWIAAFPRGELWAPILRLACIPVRTVHRLNSDPISVNAVPAGRQLAPGGLFVVVNTAGMAFYPPLPPTPREQPPRGPRWLLPLIFGVMLVVLLVVFVAAL
jgi:hypothetical protein